MLHSYYHATIIEAGLDEVGRGCLAGPVVAAAVILPKKFKNELLNDSKQLTKNQRVNLQSIIKNEALSWAIAEVDNYKIDEINILKASFLAMHLAIEKLEIIPEHLLIDGNRFVNYPMIPHTCIVKGDTKYMSIAAASILAKIYRDELMEEFAAQYQYYGWETNAGYPTKKHREGIENHGLTPLHRLSFKQL